MTFAKAFYKFGLMVSVVAAICFIVVGSMILLFPQMFFTVLVYILGGAIVLTGIAILVSLVYSLLSTKESNRYCYRKKEEEI